MPWVETGSEHFAARHELGDADDVAGLLDLLESTRERLAAAFPTVPDEVAVVVHGSDAALMAAQPYLPLLRALTAPASRRYLVGWFGSGTIHVLAPRLLESRASAVPGSREMNLLAPAGLYAQLVVGASNRALPPPFRVGSVTRYMRWAWLAEGAGQFFSGQTAFARPAIARRLREGRRPDFPPGLRDAHLLGGSVFDLLAREEGETACVRLAVRLAPGGAREALVRAFRGRALAHTEATWRAHLERLSAPGGVDGAPPGRPRRGGGGA
jgi:hypothetical protein